MTVQVAEAPVQRSLLEHTASLIREFTLEWRRETPDQIHSSSLDEGGGPAFHPDFIAYVDRPCPKKGCFDLSCRHGMRSLHPDSRVRVTRAFRRLRAEAPREFDVLYLMCRHNLSVGDITVQMNDRARRLGLPVRYTDEGIIVLAVSAAHKVEQWY